jgi:hypothetical protein
MNRPAPSILVIEGSTRTGLRRRLGTAMRACGVPIRWLRPHPGGDPASRLAIARDLATDAGTLHAGAPDADSGEPEWEALWANWQERATEAPDRVWVVDDAELLPPASWDALRSTWARVRAQALGLRLVLATADASAVRLGSIPHEHLRLPAPDATTWFGGATRWSPAERVRAAAIFGGDPALVDAVDPARSLGRNLRDLVLAPDAPFATRPLDRLVADLQRPERYLRVAEAIACGAREWGEIRQRVGGLSSSGQLGPYLKTLEASGWIESARSLDASPRSRSARYRVADLHAAFWFSCVLPAWSRLGVDEPLRVWKEVVRPRVDAHVSRALPHLVRAWLAGDRSTEVLGARARETGGLWGEGYDIAAAATLTTGAIVYGWARWDASGFGAGEVAAHTDEVRRTRYGFGRENRVRLLVQRDAPSHELARVAARDEALMVLGAADLVGA